MWGQLTTQRFVDFLLQICKTSFKKQKKMHILTDTHSLSYIICFQVKGLPSHEGPKVRHNKKDTKISRKDMRKQEQERKDPKLRRKRQKRRAEENEANSRSGHFFNSLSLIEEDIILFRFSQQLPHLGPLEGLFELIQCPQFCLMRCFKELWCVCKKRNFLPWNHRCAWGG